MIIDDNLNSKNKQIKKRVETQTWGLSEEELEHEKQLNTLLDIYSSDNDAPKKTSYYKKFSSHIKTKIQSYKQQDILKNKLNANEFTNYEYVISLLTECKLKCHYCSENIYVLYENVRESKQWSLDRINNEIGHNVGNLVISCLECNLKRRRTNKDAFMFTKNLVITREGIDT